MKYINKTPIVFLCVFFVQNCFSLCPPSNSVEFENFLSHNPSIKKIIFFSTWCADCKDKLLELKNKKESHSNVILINVFDSKGRGEKILTNMNIDVLCFHDEDKSISNKYHVTQVPFEIKN